MPREHHPVAERPELTTEQQLQHLRELVAQLWDHCWWHALPEDRRRAYEAEGFKDPIQRFYIDGDSNGPQSQ
jgi:hypothetical protein